MSWTSISAAVVSLAMCGTASAANWVQVTESERSVVLVDRDSIRSRGAHVRAWVQYQFLEKQTSESYPPVQYQSVKTLAVADCAKEQMGSVQEVLYEAMDGGLVVRSRAWPDSRAEMLEQVPGSVGDAVLRRICTGFKR